jgi:hypothetical protein
MSLYCGLTEETQCEVPPEVSANGNAGLVTQGFIGLGTHISFPCFLRFPCFHQRFLSRRKISGSFPSPFSSVPLLSRAALFAPRAGHFSRQCYFGQPVKT